MSANLENESKKPTDKIVKDREYILNNVSELLNNLNVNDFVEENPNIDVTTAGNIIKQITSKIESKFQEYKQLPELSKKKGDTNKYPLLAQHTSWMMFSMDKQQKQKIKHLALDDEGKVDFGTEKQLLSKAWEKADKDKYKKKADEQNKINLKEWIEYYSNIQTEPEEISKLLQSEENIALLGKPELRHIIGLMGLASEIDQSTTITILRHTLTSRFKQLQELKENKMSD